MPRQALIIGSSGLIAPALAKRMKGLGWHTTETSRRPSDTVPFDLARPDYSALPDRTDAVFLIAAETSLQRCEHEPQATRQINVITPARIAQRYSAAGTQVLMISTNLVFDGSTPLTRPEATRQPGCVYGAQKAELEDALLALRGPTAVLRITKVAESLAALLVGWARSLQCGEPVNAFSDMFCAPVSLHGVVEVLAQAAHQGSSGVLQHSGDRDVTYVDIARHMCIFLGLPEQLVQPVISADFSPAPIARPRHTTLAETLPPTFELDGAEDVLKALLPVCRAASRPVARK